MTFIGINKSDEICDSYAFKQNDIVMDKPTFLGSAALDLSKFLKYET